MEGGVTGREVGGLGAVDGVKLVEDKGEASGEGEGRERRRLRAAPTGRGAARSLTVTEGGGEEQRGGEGAWERWGRRARVRRRVGIAKQRCLADGEGYRAK